jgi:RNA polymerase-binding protein DksA
MKSSSKKKTLHTKLVKKSVPKKIVLAKTKSSAKMVKKSKPKISSKAVVKKSKKAPVKVVKKIPDKPKISLTKQKKLEQYKNILLEKRKIVMEGIEKLRESAKGTESENISKYYDHPAEYGTDTMDREQYFLFISREEKYLLEIERSLEAIEAGEYGTCRVCGKEIDKARIEAVPTTRICITCKMADQKARVSKTDFS